MVGLKYGEGNPVTKENMVEAQSALGTWMACNKHLSASKGADGHMGVNSLSATYLAGGAESLTPRAKAQEGSGEVSVDMEVVNVGKVKSE